MKARNAAAWPSAPASPHRKPAIGSSGPVRQVQNESERPKRDLLSLILRSLCCGMAGISFAMLFGLVIYILVQGTPSLSASLFAWTYTTDNLSMMPSIINTVFMIVLTLLVAIPLGVGAAIYLEEYANRNSWFVRAVSMTAETLAGIPSIVYGLFGMLFFVYTLHLGLSLLSGILTLAILVLPLIMRTAQEALAAVPMSMREASYALGAGKLRTIFRVILPQALPGILSGVLLATGRIAGESAALIYTSGTIAKAAFNLMDPGATLSVHLYKLLNEGLYIPQASAVAVVLLVMVAVVNLLQSLLCRLLMKGTR